MVIISRLKYIKYDIQTLVDNWLSIALTSLYEQNYYYRPIFKFDLYYGMIMQKQIKLRMKIDMIRVKE